MNFFALSALINLISSFLIGTFVLRKNIKSPTNRNFGYFCFGVIFWSVGYIFWQLSKNEESAIFWSKFFMIGASFAPLFYLTFVIHFLRLYKKRFYKIVFLAAHLLCYFFIIIIFFTDLLVKGVESRSIFDFWPIGGIFFIPFLLMFFGDVSFASILLAKWYKKETGMRKLQIRYIFLGIVLAFLGGSTNYFLWFNIEILPYAMILVSGYSILIGYAIVRYRLMNIKLIAARSFIFFFLTLSVAAVFILLTSISAIFFTGTLGANQYIVWIITSVIVVLLLEPLKNGLAQLTDKIFFKGKIDYNSIIQKLTRILAEEVNVQIIVDQTREILKADFKIRESSFLVSLSEGYFLKIAGKKESIQKKHEEIYGESKNVQENSETGEKSYYLPNLVKFFKNNKETLVKEELERKIYDTKQNKTANHLKKVYEEIKDLDAELFSPVIRENKITGILLLGSKISGDVFANEDVEMIEMLTPQLASSLFKASLFQEAKLFNIKLQKEVEKATKSLKNANFHLEDRNKNLVTLQQFSNIILSSQDINKGIQTIIDAIPKEIKYCRTVLLTLVDDSGKNLYGHAIPISSSMAKKIFALIGDNLNKYKINLNDKNSLLVKAVKTNKYQISNNLADFLSPSLPEEVASKIQKMKPVMKSAIAFPLTVGEKVLGVLHFSLTKTNKEINEEDIRMMRAVADEMGLAIERANFYTRLKKINKQLKEANDHLRDLDKAKSEFMSIASHQLRTPLSGIMGYLSMIIDGDYGQMSDEQQPILKEVYEASQRLIRLVNLFLNVTRIEAGRLKFDFREVNLCEIIRKDVHELKLTAVKKGLDLKMIEPTEEIPMVMVDLDKLQDVILNLIDNAIKYTEKGKVEVSISQADKKHIHIKVQDTGLGIEPEKVGDLFNKFVRGDGMVRVNPDGSGLGLFIARKLAEGHSGKIWAESKGLNKGSSFNVILPIKQQNKD